ncbi:helix-turn-helix transcriptional regulator [Lacrimispora defluvii]|uniref:YafY family transcriptional regulator n=1 Tax=Lacrimispora defluvii TaxID=2719233 RepID=A0ABX1VYZ1_9FIRM|nr:YafY family protein [Lacrimispora defluvii]NNJ31666.1 YafY family transcriptional regulator [Lacrimispora defluvii]
MKIDRLMGIISILLQKEKVTAPYLAEKFEVSRRTINRDVENLCKAGIPIVTEQGKNGGISIAEGYKVDKTLFTSEEIQAILSGLKSLDSVSGSNRYQLLMDKLSFGSNDYVGASGPVVINLSSWYQSSLPPKFELIKDAIERKKKIEFHYYGPNGDNTRILEPCLLIFEWSSWYVWGYCLLRDDFRMFKLNRMDQIRCTNEDCKKREIPLCHMDPRKVQWTNGVEVTAEFDKSMKWRLIEEFGINSFSENADGRLIMNIGWSDQESLFGWLLGFRDCVRIIEPVEYQKDFLNLLERIKNLY